MASRTSTTLILFCLILASFAFVQMATAAHLRGFMHFKANSNNDPNQPPEPETAKGFANFRQNSNGKGLVHVRPKSNGPPVTPVPSSAKLKATPSHGL